MHYEKFADGSIKCIEDEIPFEIPDTWCWCRLPLIANEIFAGGDKPEKCSKNKTEELNVPIFANAVENLGLYGYTNAPRVNNPSLTISARGTIGFCAIRLEPFVPIVRLITITPFAGIDLEYLSYVFEKLLEVGTGSCIPQLTIPMISTKVVPIAPEQEQHKIARAVSSSYTILNEIIIQKHNINDLIKFAKSRILDLAIRGKLVPQNPDDEPASVLLEQIKAEKEELIKQGKIKRDKKESTIFKGGDNSYYEKVGNEVKCIDAELPFEIPENWTWCRMSQLMYLVSGVTYDKHDVRKEGVRILRGGNLTNTNEIELNENDIFLPESYIDTQNQTQIGDIIIVASTGSTTVIGKPAFVESHYPKTQIGGFLKIVRPITEQAQQILRLLFRADYYHESILDRVGGVNINNIKSVYLEEMLIPVPPKHELDLIFDKYLQYSQLLSNIEASLN